MVMDVHDVHPLAHHGRHWSPLVATGRHLPRPQVFCGKGFELTSFYLKDPWNSMEFRVRRKTSQPAAQPFPPVTLFFTVGLLLKHSQGLAGKCDVF